MNYLDSDIPAPGKYDVKSEFDGTGRFFLSKFRSSGAKSIAGRIIEKPKMFQSKLNIYINNLLAPGPGQYPSYSDFGNITSTRRISSQSPNKK